MTGVSRRRAAAGQIAVGDPQVVADGDFEVRAEQVPAEPLDLGLERPLIRLRGLLAASGGAGTNSSGAEAEAGWEADV